MRTLTRFVEVSKNLLLVGVGFALMSTAVVVGAQELEAAPNCASFTSKVYDQLSPTALGQYLSANVGGYVAAAAQGFTVNRQSGLTSSPTPGASLVAVHRLYRASLKNYFYSYDSAETGRAIRIHGYVDQGIAFYAATSTGPCLQAVYSYYKAGGYHRFLPAGEDASALLEAGWKRERIRFYLGRASTAAVFTVAVIPDTQQEVLFPNDDRFSQRSKWLVENQSGLDIRFATHTGDIVNWDTPDHFQYSRARIGLAPLSGRIPYSLSPGNHDTNAVGPGGGAADPTRTRILVRETPSFNAYLNQGTTSLGGRFESGKADNSYSTFTAGGLDWLVLNLELWPRRSVVTWADSVIAQHSRHNVILATHAYLNSSGGIATGAGYGDSSPAYMFDNLVKRHANVKIVLSGHVGRAAQRQDSGAQGNVIHSFLTTMHDNHTNPLRLIEINIKANTISSAMYGPATGTTYPQFAVPARAAHWTR